MDDWGDTDFYAALGVARAASQEEIKRAFRILARELHPDMHPADWTEAQRAQATEHLQVVLRAWDALKDPERRARYDAHLRAVEIRKADAERLERERQERERTRASAEYERARREQQVRWDAASREGAWRDAARRDAEARAAWERNAAYWAALLAALTEPRRGADVYAAVELDDAAWLRGQSIYLPFGGDSISLEPMTEPGWYVFRGRGGLGEFGGPRGDLYVVVQHRFARPAARPVSPPPARPTVHPAPRTVPVRTVPVPGEPGAPSAAPPSPPSNRLPAGATSPSGGRPPSAGRRRRRGVRAAVVAGAVLGAVVVVTTILVVLALLRLLA